MVYKLSKQCGQGARPAGVGEDLTENTEALNLDLGLQAVVQSLSQFMSSYDL